MSFKRRAKSNISMATLLASVASSVSELCSVEVW